MFENDYHVHNIDDVKKFMKESPIPLETYFLSMTRETKAKVIKVEDKKTKAKAEKESKKEHLKKIKEEKKKAKGKK